MAFPRRERKCRCIVEYRQARVEDSGRTDRQTDIETDRQTDTEDLWGTIKAGQGRGRTDRQKQADGWTDDGRTWRTVGALTTLVIQG